MQFTLISSSEVAQCTWNAHRVLVVMPFTEPLQAQRAAQLMAQRAGIDGLILGVYDADREGYISIVNQIFQKSKSEWFCYVAQDAFAGRHWLAFALHALKKNSGKLLAFNDGKWHGQLAAFGIAERKWVEQQYGNHFFFSEYQQHYADTELTLIALQQQCLVYSADSILIEVDWHKESAYININDKNLFFRRAAHFFNGKVTDVSLLKKFSVMTPLRPV